MKDTFTDLEKRTWKLEFDAILLEDIEADAGVDLADLSAGGLAKTQTDVKILGRVVGLTLAYLGKTPEDPREFVRTHLRGEVITEAKAAVLGAAAAFFPASEWSVIQSHLSNRLKTNKVFDEVRALRGVDASDLSDTLKTSVLQAIRVSDMDSSQSEESESAGGQGDTHESSATD